jgi:nicotinamide riboside transporter PnuC
VIAAILGVIDAALFSENTSFLVSFGIVAVVVFFGLPYVFDVYGELWEMARGNTLRGVVARVRRERWGR